MDGHHIADPWDLPEPSSEPEAGTVTTASKPARPGLFERRTDTQADESRDHTAPVSTDDTSGAVSLPALAEGEPVHIEDVASPTDGTASRFDLGLETTEADHGEEAAASVGETSDFDLFIPDTDAEEQPDYEVDEPDLTERFVTSNGPGRPDLSAPQLRDPMPILALDESEVPGDAPAPGASTISLVDEVGAVMGSLVDDTHDIDAPADAPADASAEAPQDAGHRFRLPGLSLFSRTKSADDDAAADDEYDADGVLPSPDVREAIDDIALLAPADEGTDDGSDHLVDTPALDETPGSAPVSTPGAAVSEPDADVAIVPTAWIDADPTDTAASSDGVAPAAPSAWAVPFDGASYSGADPEPTPVPADTLAADPFAVDADAGPTDDHADEAAPADASFPPVDETSADAIADEPGAVLDPEADAEVDTRVDADVEAEQVLADDPGEDAMEIELTDPDLNDLTSVEELYVTEETVVEDTRTALLTVDAVPGSTITKALDVVTAVASAPVADDISGAMDRAMEQLREKATDLGGRAVISVRSEVQEIGGGFLVTASGTAVELA